MTEFTLSIHAVVCIKFREQKPTNIGRRKKSRKYILQRTNVAIYESWQKKLNILLLMSTKMAAYVRK